MSLKMPGKPPLVVENLPTTKSPISMEATKIVMVGALAASRHGSAGDVLHDSTFKLVHNTLQIETSVSTKLLPVLFNAEVVKIMNSALAERGYHDIKVEVLPAPAPVTSVVMTGLPFESSSSPFKRLVDSAAKLNAVSDQLTTQIEGIDASLKRLNLGVTAWVTISSNEDEDGSWSQEQLGYARIGNRWGVVLKTCSGMRGVITDSDDDTFSAFADAPRQMRIRAIPYIPKLLDELSVEAEKMIAKLSPEVEKIEKLTLALQFLGVKK